MRAGWRITLIGAAANAALVVLKFVGGTLGNSHALIADAAHSVSDLFTDAIVLLGLHAGRKAPDASHPYGHGRIETLASTVLALSLVGVAAYIAIDAARSLLSDVERHPTLLAAACAAVSIVAKEALYRVTLRVGKRARSAAIIANAWHHRSDALSSVAVLFGIVGALIVPSWYALDAYAALVVSALILRAGLVILWGSIKEITDAAPPAEVVNAIRARAGAIDGVLDVHDLKVRTSGGYYQIELHVVVDAAITVAEGHQIADAVESALHDDLDGVGDAIVHIEPPTETRSA